ncbi:MAG: membrane protein insertase YidC [Gammaproteobacteria bacterium]|nr:MAG: membrane protein insertase YidC [Gammaproteobacteria bacterium]
MENQRFFLYIALAFLLYIIWLTWQQEQAPAPVAQQDSTLQQNTDTGNENSFENSDDLPDALDSKQITNTASNVVDKSVTQSKSQKVHVRTDVLDVIIDTRGGDIRQIDLPTYPVSLKEQDEAFRLMFSNNRTYIAQSGLRHDKINGQSVSGAAPTHHEVYRAEQTEYLLDEGRDELEVKLLWSGENGISVEKIFTFYRDSFVFDVKHRVMNQGDTSWAGRQYQQLRHSPISEKRSWLRLPTYTGTAYFDGAYHKHKFSDVEDEPINMQVDGGWVAVLQHYFVSAWIPEAEEQNRFYSKAVTAAGENQLLIGMLSSAQTVAPNSSAEFNRRLYAGPKIQNDMKQIAMGLDLSVDYGMFSILSKPLFWLLQWFHNLVGNWGLSIILVTVVVKLIFYKLSETSYKSMARMRKLQPRIKALQERFADDKQKLGQATWDLYRKEKVNPAKGCLPILIQMPVFLALYWVLIESVELRQAPFMFWIHDLSIRDPIFVLPFLMGISMFIQFKLNPAPPDPMQAKIFAMMPIMMTIFMAFFPAGLVLYWLVNNILSIIQQYVITKRIEKETN